MRNNAPQCWRLVWIRITNKYYKEDKSARARPTNLEINVKKDGSYTYIHKKKKRKKHIKEQKYSLCDIQTHTPIYVYKFSSHVKNRSKRNEIVREIARVENVCGHAYNENCMHECQFPKFRCVVVFFPDAVKCKLHSGRAARDETTKWNREKTNKSLTFASLLYIYIYICNIYTTTTTARYGLYTSKSSECKYKMKSSGY